MNFVCLADLANTIMDYDYINYNVEKPHIRSYLISFIFYNYKVEIINWLTLLNSLNKFLVFQHVIH